jgi:hypothetical protein
MGRMGVRLLASATAALCLLAWVASSASASGSRTIARAPSVKLNTVLRGSLYDDGFSSGYAGAYWTASFKKGDHISIRTTSSGQDTPPCQLIFPPGTNDANISPTATLLDPVMDSQTRHGATDGQRWVADQTGIYVLAMTNDDVYLSGPHQCLDAPAGRPFTFRVTVAHAGAGAGAVVRSPSSTRVVQPGQSLWLIAKDVLGAPAGIGQVAFEVGRLWRLNAARIGTGDPDLIYPGLKLRLK